MALTTGGMEAEGTLRFVDTERESSTPRSHEDFMHPVMIITYVAYVIRLDSLCTDNSAIGVALAALLRSPSVATVLPDSGSGEANEAALAGARSDGTYCGSDDWQYGGRRHPALCRP